MATTNLHPFLLLFVSLFFLPAALGAAFEFETCQTVASNEDRVNVTKVEITPYPIKYRDNPIFEITGVTPKSFVTGLVRIVFTSSDGFTDYFSKFYNLCDVTKCPVAPGSIVLTIANAYKKESISGECGVSVQIFRSSNNTMPVTYPDLCVTFKFHATALKNSVNYPRLDGVIVTEVEIIPSKVTVKDSPIFRITGFTPKNLTNAIIKASMVKLDVPPRFTSRVYNICHYTLCPVVSGPIELTFPHPYLDEQITAGRYSVIVQIFDQMDMIRERMFLTFEFPISEA